MRTHFLTAVALIIASVVSGCQAGSGICEQMRANGIVMFNANNACGCARRECPTGTSCVDGDCVDPQRFMNDPLHCGGGPACASGEVCSSGQCCNPMTAETESNCGCKGKCDDSETCQMAPQGYQCQCDEALASNDPNRCGCEPPGKPKQICNTHVDRCRNSRCECDPTAQSNQEDVTNCGCRGPCVDGDPKATAYCKAGICYCKNASHIICGGICMPAEKCDCNLNLTDCRNCGCSGPCATGEKCVGGKKVCDPLGHQTDNTNCGCSGKVCNVAGGQSCVGGVCSCPANSCGTVGGSDGACIMCAAGEHCGPGPGSSRRCVCDLDANLSNTLNCGCNGPCGAGIIGAPEVCSGGICMCPSNTYRCEPFKVAPGIPVNWGVCWPSTGDNHLCGDCAGVCTAPQLCAYEQDMSKTVTRIYCK